MRFYFIAGTQHSPSRFPPSAGNGQQPDNAVDFEQSARTMDKLAAIADIIVPGHDNYFLVG